MFPRLQTPGQDVESNYPRHKRRNQCQQFTKASGGEQHCEEAGTYTEVRMGSESLRGTHESLTDFRGTHPCVTQGVELFYRLPSPFSNTTKRLGRMPRTVWRVGLDFQCAMLRGNV